MVFAEHLPDADQSVQAMLHRLMIHVEEAKTEHPFFGCSVGVFATSRRCSFEEYYKMADQALYEATRQGKGCFYIKSDVSEEGE